MFHVVQKKQTGAGAGGALEQNTCNDVRLVLKNKFPEQSYK